ncbi:MAG: NAD(P)/FAD-dependent oxidoreductase [Myxococcales bacterium]
MHEHFDVLIVGAGISGIGAGYHLKKNCPDRSFTILEGRDAIGGTWDLFRYPGIRSDSDMYTLGYSFRPWTEPKAIADGPSILTYVKDTAREYEIDKKIRFSHHVKRASWSSEDARWTIDVDRVDSGERVQLTCNYLHMCSGYYNYKAGYTPDFDGMDDFEGRIVHPQHWTDDIETEGKRIVVIGSGATAVTLVPELAKGAEHVTMLQRSPTYVVALPDEDALANGLRARLPARVAYGITRWKNVLGGMFIFWLSRKYPAFVKRRIIEEASKQLGPEFDVKKHFTPRYNPWDQRMCLVPNGDLFESLKNRSASVVTDHVDTFTKTGIRLRGGEELDADLVVTATGLDLQVLSDLEVIVDGDKIDLAQTTSYKGMMFSDVPNLATSIGYTNASWTLKCDLTCGYVCRVLNHMRAHGYRQCTPRIEDPNMEREAWIDFTSGYVQRSLHKFPKQGTRKPWRLNQNYALDLVSLGLGRLEDGAMKFEGEKRAAERR